MISLQHQRVGVFIDVQNMYYSAKALYNQKVDFGKILELGVGDRTLVRAIAYVIQAEADQENQFFDALRDRGLELRIKDLQTFYGGNKKGDWDVGIAMDVMRLASKLDVIVLVSGDGDFTDLLKHAKSLGCYTEAIAFGPSSSSMLREEADKFTDLAEHLDSVLIGTSRYAKKKSNHSSKKSKSRANQNQTKASQTQHLDVKKSADSKNGQLTVLNPTPKPATKRRRKPARKPASKPATPQSAAKKPTLKPAARAASASRRNRRTTRPAA